MLQWTLVLILSLIWGPYQADAQKGQLKFQKYKLSMATKQIRSRCVNEGESHYTRLKMYYEPQAAVVADDFYWMNLKMDLCIEYLGSRFAKFRLELPLPKEVLHTYAELPSHGFQRDIFYVDRFLKTPARLVTRWRELSKDSKELELIWQRDGKDFGPARMVFMKNKSPLVQEVHVEASNDHLGSLNIPFYFDQSGWE